MADRQGNMRPHKGRLCASLNTFSSRLRRASASPFDSRWPRSYTSFSYSSHLPENERTCRIDFPLRGDEVRCVEDLAPLAGIHAKVSEQAVQGRNSWQH